MKNQKELGKIPHDKIFKHIILVVSAGLIIASLFIEPKWRVDKSIFESIALLWGFYLLMKLRSKKKGGTVSIGGWSITLSPQKTKDVKNEKNNSVE